MYFFVYVFNRGKWIFAHESLNAHQAADVAAIHLRDGADRVQIVSAESAPDPEKLQTSTANSSRPRKK